jgi:hypothetical protein
VNYEEDDYGTYKMRDVECKQCNKFFHPVSRIEMQYHEGLTPSEAIRASWKRSEEALKRFDKQRS